LFGLIMERL